jgi:hypothetical protein
MRRIGSGNLAGSQSNWMGGLDGIFISWFLWRRRLRINEWIVLLWQFRLQRRLVWQIHRISRI